MRVYSVKDRKLPFPIDKASGATEKPMMSMPYFVELCLK